MSVAHTEADSKINGAVREANNEIKSAQEVEGEKVAAAQAGFMKLREDYRHTMTMNLVGLDQRVSDLDGKSTQSQGVAKTTLDAILKQIHEDRSLLEADRKSLESTTAATWDDAKARLDKEWTHLSQLVDKA